MCDPNTGSQPSAPRDFHTVMRETLASLDGAIAALQDRVTSLGDVEGFDRDAEVRLLTAQDKLIESVGGLIASLSGGKPTPVDSPPVGGWAWWASFDGGERYSVGPEVSREAVIEAAREYGGGDPFVVVEATQRPVRLSDFIDVEDLVERADERAWEDHGDPDDPDDSGNPIFDFSATGPVAANLEARIKRAVDEWQDANGVAPVSWRFTETRNEETIPASSGEVAP